MPYFESRIETDGQIFNPSTPLNSSFQCAPKVSLSQSYISQFRKRNQTPSAFGRNLDFLSYELELCVVTLGALDRRVQTRLKIRPSVLILEAK